MTDGTSARTHRLGMAMLPMGIAIAVVAALRVVLMVAGVASTNAIDVVLVVGLTIAAALVIRSGREYRRRFGDAP